MNNDIEVAPDLVDVMVRVAESDPKIGCVAPKAYYHGDRERIWSAGGRIRFREAVTTERGEGRTRPRPVRPHGGRRLRQRRRHADPARGAGTDRHLGPGLLPRRRGRGLLRTGAAGRLPHGLRARGPALAHDLGLDRRLQAFPHLPHGALDGDLPAQVRPGPPVGDGAGHVRRVDPLRLAAGGTRKGNQAAVSSKVRGYLEGLRVQLPPLPRADELRDLRGGPQRNGE